jgi:hypothetical protein
VDAIVVDTGPATEAQTALMSDPRRLAGLADASDHLWRARHELLSAGYGLWVGNLLELIEAISLEIEWLSREGGGSEPAC